MEHQDILDVIVREAVAILSVDATDVVPDAKFGETLDADSVDLVEVAGVLERAFDVQIDDRELHDIITVGDLVELVARKR